MSDHICLGPGCKECKFPETGKIKKKRGTKQLRNNSKNQERNLGKEYLGAGFEKARRVPGSGAFSTLPGDVDPGDLLLAECKMTRTGKITVDPEWVNKIDKQAQQVGRPWWALHLWVASQESRFSKVVVISEEFFFELLRRMRDAERELEN